VAGKRRMTWEAESTFSRAFAEFSETSLASKWHEALIIKNDQEQTLSIFQEMERG